MNTPISWLKVYVPDLDVDGSAAGLRHRRAE